MTWLFNENDNTRWECACKMRMPRQGDFWHGGGDTSSTLESDIACTQGENAHVRWECACKVRIPNEVTFSENVNASHVRWLVSENAHTSHVRWLFSKNALLGWECLCEGKMQMQGDFSVKTPTQAKNILARWKYPMWGENVRTRWEFPCKVTLTPHLKARWLFSKNTHCG